MFSSLYPNVKIELQLFPIQNQVVDLFALNIIFKIFVLVPPPLGCYQTATMSMARTQLDISVLEKLDKHRELLLLNDDKL